MRIKPWYRLLALAFWCSTTAGFPQAAPPPLGCFPHTNGTTFRVWAPNATNVALGGDFNNWQAAAMRPETDGLWSLTIPAAQPGQHYKYLINNTLWKRDPRARQVNHSNGDSIVYDPAAFDWGRDRPPRSARNDWVIYQLHIGTFAGRPLPATFDDAIPYLDHIRALGCTAVAPLPVNEFPGAFSWGYNPSDPYAIETDYGGPAAFKRFVHAAHARGLAVIADVIHNHYGPTDLDLWRFDGAFWNGEYGGIYFYNDSRAETPWGHTRPDFGRPEVRAYIRDQIFMYADEYHVDGFRWDSIYHIINSGWGPNPEAIQMLHDINRELAHSRPDILRIAEDHGFDHDMGFDAQWDVGHRWALFNQLVTAHDPERDMHTVAGTLTDWPGFQRIIFTEAHDYVARMNENRSRVPTMIHPEDPTSIWARKRALLGAAMIFTTPGIPMIFQGQEMLETRAFHDDVPMNWSLTNTYAGNVQAYADLIRLRRNLNGATPGLQGSGVYVQHLDDEQKVIAFTRWNQGGATDDVVVIANFSSHDFTANDYSIRFPTAGTWHRQFNSDSTCYFADFGDVGADQVEATGNPPAAPVNMGRYSLQIFSKNAPDSPPLATISY